MELSDYGSRDAFSPQEMEHILQLPLLDIVELLARVPRAGGGRFQGDGCRALVRKLARGRLFADLIARRAVNAEPVIGRGPESNDPDLFHLINESSGETLSVRFPGDLACYLVRLRQQSASPQEPASLVSKADGATEAESEPSPPDGSTA